MTETAARRRAGILARVLAWIERRQHELSDRVHAAGDECARQQGWEVTKSTGRFGFGARSYRDPRFGDRRRQLGRRPTGGLVIGGNGDHECRNGTDDYEPGKEAGE
jgi:hypothetical protein